jgi:hypothetical protein
MEKDNIIQRKYFLEALPDDYLKGIVREKIKAKEERKKLLERILNKKIKNSDKSLKNLTHSKLIDLFIQFNLLSIEEEKNYFLQFRDSKDPIFYLFKIQRKFVEDLDKIKEKIESFIKANALGINYKFIEKNKIIENQNKFPYKYKDFELIGTTKLDYDHEILELSFEYFEKLNYLKKDYIPSFVYNLRSGFLWLDRINQLIIVKCHDYNIVNVVISALGELFNSKYFKFNLQQVIVDKIFSRKEIVKNVLKADKFKNPGLIESLIVRDKDYAEKSKDPKYSVLSEYERKSGSYLTDIKGFSKKIKINVIESGKISLTGKSIKLDKCREWLIDVILKIISIQENLVKDGDINSYIKSSDFIERSKLFMNIKSQEARKKISELINKINILKTNPTLNYVDFNFPPGISFYFDEYMIPLVDLRCSNDECDISIMCPNNKCDSIEFIIKKSITKRTFELKCMYCNNEIKVDTELECIDGHAKKLDLNEAIFFIFHPALKIELNHILNGLKLGYQIQDEKETFHIKENKLYRTEISGKIVYSWNELPIFKEIPKLNEIPKEVQKQQVLNIKETLEKCSNRANKCRGCHIYKDDEKSCLLRIFAKLSGGQAHPHSGDEFGDFEFPQDFLEGRELIIGIAKSYKKPTIKRTQILFNEPFDLLTYKKNDNLLEQFFQLSNEDTVRFIMVVSGRIIDSRLKAALIEIAKWKSKKIVIIEPEDLIPIFSVYY